MAEGRQQTHDDTECLYWAFISYSQHDAKFARRLHEWIEQYRIPRSLVGQRSGDLTIPRRLFPIFRDREELSSSSDLPSSLNDALRRSRALIVICSPRAADSTWVGKEVIAFKTSGRADRIFPIILEGEPNADSSASECFPPALRFVVDAAGRITKTSAEPVAADVRDGKDGWPDACLKLVAGILGVRFDALRQREMARAKRRRLFGLASAVAAGIVAGMIYIALADSGLNLPGGQGLRSAIDRESWTIFRPVPPQDAVDRKLDQLRGNLRSHLHQSILSNKVRIGIAPNSTTSPWEVAQVAAALYSDRDAGPPDLAPLQGMLAHIFSRDSLIISDGPLGWHEGPPLARAEIPLYLSIALSRIVGRNDPAFSEIEPIYKNYLQTTQRILDRFYVTQVGAWKVAAEEDSESWFTYTSILALETLLELRANGVCWHDSCEYRDEMIRNTSTWIVKSFLNRAEQPGWEPESQYDLQTGADPDLSAFAYAVLARAAVEAKIRLPRDIETSAFRQLSNMANRPYKPAYTTLNHWVSYVDNQGRREGHTLTVRTFWYPWSIKAIQYWLRYADLGGWPLEYKVALQRTRGHLVIDLSDEMMDDVAHSLPFAAAEIDYCLNGAR